MRGAFPPLILPIIGKNQAVIVVSGVRIDFSRGVDISSPSR